MAGKFITKRMIAAILGVSRPLVDSELKKMCSEKIIKEKLGTYNKRLGFSEKQISVLKENSVLFEDL